MPLVAEPSESFPLAPDFNRVLTVLRLAGEPDRVPNMELHVDWQIKQAFLGRPIRTVQDDVDFWYRAGYDYVHLRANYEYRMVGDGHREQDRLYAGDMQLSKWEAEEHSLIGDWRDFETYPWPDPERIDFSNLVECARCLYPGMKIISGVGGIFTRVWRIMGFETFALALADQPELVAALFERVARIQLAVFRRILTMEGIGAMWYGDDLAYYSGTMVRPAVLRRHLFPALAEMGALCGQHDLPFIIHSDGNLWRILPDLIACGFSAIHPVEPKAMDSRQLKAEIGDKLALLGNIEIGEVLTLGSPAEVAADVRAHIRDLAPGGGYAVGSSNTVAHYIPLDNFVAMVQATRQFGRYPICL